MKNLAALLFCAPFLMSTFGGCEDNTNNRDACGEAALPGDSNCYSLCEAIDDCYGKHWDTDQVYDCADECSLDTYSDTHARCGVIGWAYGCDEVTECVETCGDLDQFEP
jgi:hypothetical protein